MCQNRILHGHFVSEWDGIRIKTPAVLDLKAGFIEKTVAEVDGLDLDSLVRQYFEDADGNEYPVCPECQDNILKTVMVKTDGINLKEVERCSYLLGEE